MKPKSLILLTLTVMVVAIFTFYPSTLFSPGGLHKTHATIDSCDRCHEPFTKPGGNECTAAGCHDNVDWEKDKGIFTGHLKQVGCLNCHTEHKGSDGDITLAEPHTNIRPDANCLECHRLGPKHTQVKVQDCKVCHSIDKWKPAKGGHDTVKNINNCTDCHTLTLKHFRTAENCAECHTAEKWKPAKFDHAKYGKGSDCRACHKLPVKHVKSDANCSECHSSNKWKPATFDHKKLSQGSDCIVCHKLPKKHFKTTANCSECHTTDKWKPSTFVHRFPMQHETKRKKNSCETCHPLSLDEYDCYTGCHEHSVRNVAREHREEGIREYSDCMKCHPTGREHERRGEYRKERKHHDDHDDDDWYDKVKRKFDDDHDYDDDDDDD